MKTSTNIKVKETGFSFRKNEVGLLAKHIITSMLWNIKKKKKKKQKWRPQLAACIWSPQIKEIGYCKNKCIILTRATLMMEFNVGKKKMILSWKDNYELCQILSRMGAWDNKVTF